jgi:hypothetical protein
VPAAAISLSSSAAPGPRATLPFILIALPWTVRKSTQPGFDWTGLALGSLTLDHVSSRLATMFRDQDFTRLPIAFADQLFILESFSTLAASFSFLDPDGYTVTMHDKA